MRRLLLGVVSLLLIVVGGVWSFVIGSEDSQAGLGAYCLRAGLVLGALWLAYEDASRIPAWMFGAVIVGILVLARYPMLVVYAIPALIIVGIWRKSSAIAERDRKQREKEKEQDQEQ